MKATIFHKTNGRFFEANTDTVSLDDYEEVGTYESGKNIPEVETDYFLDEVYMNSNSIHRHWSENEGVTGGKRARSTSVGDLIKIGTVFFEVASVGFVQKTVV
jgi:hypothetical protein